MFYSQAVEILGFLDHWDFRGERWVYGEVKWVDPGVSLLGVSPG